MEACEVIKNFYISLRENAINNANTLPITSRALDSLIRLSQARAKLELRAIVSRHDAMTVVKLIQESIFEACYTEMGIGGNQYAQVPVQMPQNMTGTRGKGGKNEINPNDISLLSIPKQTKFFVEALRQRTEQEGNKVLEFQDMVDIGKSMNLQTGDFK